jgi:ABC-type antimicrobial peptide transport system permease subunit
MKPGLAGLIIGILASLAATRLLQTMIYDVSPTDPAVMVAVAFLLAAITVVACFVPAWRATRIDPVVALRSE